MSKVVKEKEVIKCKDKNALRKWLEKNHDREESVWLILHKKNSTKGSLSYVDAVEAGLCFGWIDSKPNKIDEDTFKLLFSPRKKKSVWSKINKKRVKQLKKQGLMHASGLARIEAAKKDGSWKSLDAVEEFEMPADLTKAFSKNKKAKEFFDAFPSSVRKQILWWVSSAKREETRSKRIKETVSLAAKNIRANQYTPPQKKT